MEIFLFSPIFLKIVGSDPWPWLGLKPHEVFCNLLFCSRLKGIGLEALKVLNLLGLSSYHLWDFWKFSESHPRCRSILVLCSIGLAIMNGLQVWSRDHDGFHGQSWSHNKYWSPYHYGSCDRLGPKVNFGSHNHFGSWWILVPRPFWDCDNKMFPRPDLCSRLMLQLFHICLNVQPVLRL